MSTWVDDGRAEVGVVGARPTLRTLVSRELMPDELVVVVPPEHPWAGRKSITLDDLKREPLICASKARDARARSSRRWARATSI